MRAHHGGGTGGSGGGHKAELDAGVSEQYSGKASTSPRGRHHEGGEYTSNKDCSTSRSTGMGGGGGNNEGGDHHHHPNQRLSEQTNRQHLDPRSAEVQKSARNRRKLAESMLRNDSLSSGICTYDTGYDVSSLTYCHGLTALASGSAYHYGVFHLCGFTAYSMGLTAENSSALK